MPKIASVFRGQGLAQKLVIINTIALMAVLVIFWLHFDRFLQHRFLDNAHKRMENSYTRVIDDLGSIYTKLSADISLLKVDQLMLASVELINNYQNKADYNTYLIDEEKKLLTDKLLNFLRISGHDQITLFDKNEEMVAEVVRKDHQFSQSYLSFDRGIMHIMHRGSEDAHFSPQLNNQNISFQHQYFYPPEKALDGRLVTYHRQGDDLVMRAHQTILDPVTDKMVAHVELLKVLDKEYFKHLSQGLDVRIDLSFEDRWQPLAVAVKPGEAVPNIEIDQTETDYISAISVAAMDGDMAYFTGYMDKHPLIATLAEHRQQFIGLLLVVGICSLLLMQSLIRYFITHPLNSLMVQILKIAKGDYSFTAAPKTGDELETISSSVNQLAQTVSEREASLQMSKRELKYLSDHDALTDLPNRRLFERSLEQLILDTQMDQKFALLFIDLDQFKQVNDTLGHDVGDQLLVQVSTRLLEQLHSNDLIARIGGDEFNILVTEFDSLDELQTIAEHYLGLFREPFLCGTHSVITSASIGISLCPDDGRDRVSMVKHADLALYKAKERGRSQYCFFSDYLSVQMKLRAEMTIALKEALRAGDQFELYYQPKISVADGRMLSVEALIRWNSPIYGFLGPARFIELAEESGLIVGIGEWVLRQAVEEFMRLQDEGIQLDYIAVNLSNVQLRNDSIIHELQSVIAQTGIKPKQLELEITESYIATNVDHAIDTLQLFRDLGVGLAIDDFGTGYSSMSYLQRLPVSRLKIDKSFVDGVPHDQGSVALIKAIIGLAKHFKLGLTAEGVENIQQLDFLIAEGIDEVQGYLYSKPLSLEQLKEYHRETRQHSIGLSGSSSKLH